MLSGLGTYLFVRDVTGNPTAAFVAGLIYAFAPYRVPQFAHLQVISSQWMPFALYGLRRYFETSRYLPLAGAAAALIAQNLSNGYFLFFFSPFVAAYVALRNRDTEIVAQHSRMDCHVGRGRSRGSAHAALSVAVPRAETSWVSARGRSPKL